MAAKHSKVMNALRRMNLVQRFVALGVLVLTLIGYQLYLYMREANKMIEMTATELAGMPAVASMIDGMRVMQNQRGVATAWISGPG